MTTTQLPTVKLNNNAVVLANKHGGAWKGANLTQARKKAAKLQGLGHDVRVIGMRPFFVAVGGWWS